LSYGGLLLTASFGAIPVYHGAMASIADRTNMPFLIVFVGPTPDIE
jgi:hypothetical protein